MIDNFKNSEVRVSGLMYNSTFEQIKELHQYNPEQAGELAISAIELLLTGDMSTDDVMIRMMLKPMQKINENNITKYESKVEATKQKKIQTDKLDKIAEMVNAGYKQSEIGERLGISQQMVSYRISVIKTKYPDLLNDPGRTKDFTNNTKEFTNDTNTLQKYKSEGAKSFVEISDEPIVDYTQPYRF